MKVVRYFESHAQPNDTMFVEIDDWYRFTGRGKSWDRFREHLIKVIEDTIGEDFAKAFAAQTEDWVDA